MTESVDFNISGGKIGVTQPENFNKSKKSEKKKNSVLNSFDAFNLCTIVFNIH